jgi:hypothetical protein
MNSSDSMQDLSFLNHLLDVSAATPEFLCQRAEKLEKLGNPYLIGYAQLPFQRIFPQTRDQ